MRLKLIDDLFRDRALNAEHVLQIAIVIFGPELRARMGINQVRADADPVSGAPDTAFEHMPHAEFPADRAQIPRLVGGIFTHTATADYLQVGHATEIRQDVILHAFGEKEVGLVPVQIFKWQNRDRLFGRGRDRQRRERSHEQPRESRGQDHATRRRARQISIPQRPAPEMNGGQNRARDDGPAIQPAFQIFRQIIRGGIAGLRHALEAALENRLEIAIHGRRQCPQFRRRHFARLPNDRERV